MAVHPDAITLLLHEARALLTRVERVGSFVLYETMLPAAAVAPDALLAIERHVTRERAQLATLVRAFVGALTAAKGDVVPHEAQRQFALLRIRFNNVLTQIDLFADALTQRSERDNGIWLKGLDVFALDALRLPGTSYEVPPVICYLDRGVGAAIRRARTRLPGGGSNPLAIVRIPRERMVGSGVASSLAHEVGHQAAALLGLVETYRPLLRARQRGAAAAAWQLWERWISECVADLWSVARVGVSGTLGLLGVVSLPVAFVARVSPDDPHPTPWIRVRASAAMGHAIFPHEAWGRLSAIWEALYPMEQLPAASRATLQALDATLPELGAIFAGTPVEALGGRSLAAAVAGAGGRPADARSLFTSWRALPTPPVDTAPSRAFAALGQARVDGVLAPEAESRMAADLLTAWATAATLDTTRRCVPQASPVLAPTT